MILCAQCKTPLETPKFCSCCKKDAYCGPKCQKLAWPAHKVIYAASNSTKGIRVSTSVTATSDRPASQQGVQGRGGRKQQSGGRARIGLPGSAGKDEYQDGEATEVGQNADGMEDAPKIHTPSLKASAVSPGVPKRIS
ncbi:hypothetical protein M427DRAFT_327364 [Gonapodya prolifera JEL478]|uniref:MYND-type domain-containing protein n=1 Tax=Gonapodya prolifera (strain JEL478) TaxID=1344416 RepID=A0A139AEP4_GONPJ|nr:hypothetical protein M427DRAFT_327364 [Gonapodya prolifera JEL478]|eukprot:KXS15296.1 hypothetical protein M427DRAFT_327364 [Gonapodya prolifera JEL478]